MPGLQVSVAAALRSAMQVSPVGGICWNLSNESWYVNSNPKKNEDCGIISLFDWDLGSLSLGYYSQ